MNIFFDLDGTLVDSRLRMYSLFQSLVSESKMSFDAYWRLKKENYKHRDILQKMFSYSEQESMAFEGEWLKSIELPSWLALDRPVEGVTEYLKRASEKSNLYIVTARQSEKNALSQISSFGWLELFDKIMVTNLVKQKHEMIKYVVKIEKTDWFIGDTGADIESGKKLGVKTAGVLSGFMSKEGLLTYKPDLIVNSVVDLKIT